MKQFYFLVFTILITTVTYSQSFSIGDNVQANATINVRTITSGVASTTSLGTHVSGDKGVIIGGPTIATLSGVSYTWYQVQWQTSPTTGWSVNSGLTKVTATPCDIFVLGTPTILPNPVTAGNSITVSYTIKNQGGSTAIASQTKIQIKNSSGTLITAPTFSDPSILAGGSATQSQIVPIPSGTPAGTYTAIIILDNLSQLGQSNVTNDITAGVSFAVAAPPTPCDIFVLGTPTILPNPVTAGNSITVSYTIKNQGGSTAIASQTKIQIKNSSGTLITAPTFSDPSILAGGSATQSQIVPIPSGTPAGTYTAIIILDNLSQLGQSNVINDITAGVSFTVNAVLSSTPTITSVSPNPITADVNNNYQTVTINGTNFVATPTIKLTWTGQTNYTLPSSQILSVTSNQIQLSIKLGNATDNWTVTVTNPDGKVSNTMGFDVVTSSYCTNCVTCFGTLLGSFNGVNAYSNCSADYDSKTYNYETGINTGLKYQCVEFVNRYYKVVYGLDLKSTGIYGNANHYYSNASSAGLIAYPNGGSVAPQVGDIICSNGNSSNVGHVAIVKAVNSTTIEVIQQNFSNAVGGCYTTLSRSGNTISDFISGSYPVTGWLRYQGSSANTPTITSISPGSMSGSVNEQLLVIYGYNFSSSAYLIFTDTKGNPYSSLDHPERFTYVNDGQINYTINNMNDCGTWYVKVCNTSNSYSNSYSFAVNCTAQTNTILGIDVSHHNGSIDWSKVYQSGKSFAYVKATGGTNFNDDQFKPSMTSSNPYKVVLGAYHFAYPTYYSANAEAQHFLSIAAPFIGSGFLPPALDIEDDAANNSFLSQLTASELTNWVKEWLTIVENATHVKPIVYTSSQTYAPVLQASLNNYGLWIANTTGCDANSNPSTGNWSSWVFHQYVDPSNPPCKSTFPNCAGITTPVDLDIFNGDINAFNALINNTTTAITEISVNNITCSLYPNPASSVAMLRLFSIPAFKTTVTLFNSFGQQVYSKTVTNQTEAIPVSNLPNGYYLVKIVSKNETGVLKLIVTH